MRNLRETRRLNLALLLVFCASIVCAGCRSNRPRFTALLSGEPQFTQPNAKEPHPVVQQSKKVAMGGLKVVFGVVWFFVKAAIDDDDEDERNRAMNSTYTMPPLPDWIP